MHPTARKSLTWGLVLLVGGALVVAYGTELYLRLSDVAGANAEAGLWVVSAVINILRGALLPLGAALVGAAVVIQALAPGLRERESAARGREGR